MSQNKTVRIKMLSDLDIYDRQLKAGEVYEARYDDKLEAYQLYELGQPTHRYLIPSVTLLQEIKSAA